MANNFKYYSPTEVIFGKDVEQETGKQLKRLGASHVLLVYGGNSARRLGLLDKVRYSLTEEGISVSELEGIVPNPRLDKVYEGIRIGKVDEIDFLLAIGGGSAIDTAKAIAYGLAEPEYDVWELFQHIRTAKNVFP